MAQDQSALDRFAKYGWGGGQFPSSASCACNVLGCPTDCLGDHEFGNIQAAVPAAGAAGNPVDSVSKTQKKVIPRRLYVNQVTIASATIMLFQINKILIGTENVLSTNGPIDPSIYLPNSECPDWRSLCLDPGIDFVVNVQNLDIAAHDWRSTATAFMRKDPA
jgi:hypothetical protein